MLLVFFAAWWGRDGDGVDAMVDEVAGSGYDGIETFVPADPTERRRLATAIQRAGLVLVSDADEADGADATCRHQLAENLRRAGDLAPILVNLSLIHI